MGTPRFLPLSPINENNPAVINPLKRLAWGSIFGGLLVILNINLFKTPVLTIPAELKLAALAVSILGLLTALELATLTSKQFKVTPLRTPHHFSTSLGFVPAIIHRQIPQLSLLLGQKIASQIVDQTWLEKTGPKAIANATTPLASATSNIQQGLIKTYLTLFLITLVLVTLISAT